ncbi:hypothetical protein AB0N05_29835 [Nocardia sp. NPDC051030]
MDSSIPLSPFGYSGAAQPAAIREFVGTVLGGRGFTDTGVDVAGDQNSA